MNKHFSSLKQASCKTSLNQGWIFHDGDAEMNVTLPHNAVDLPYDYPDETSYQRDFHYSYTLELDRIEEDKVVSLVFDGVMADTRVSINNTEVVHHPDGYTPFEAVLTPHLTPGTNRIDVRLSGVENPAIPPFGGPLGFLTFAGIYRDVWLRVTGTTALEDVQVIATDIRTDKPVLTAHCTLRGEPASDLTVKLRLCDAKGQPLATASACATDKACKVTLELSETPHPWDIDDPYLHRVEVTLSAGETICDRKTISYGFREAKFTPQGFLLNGRPLKLLGLNRHQSFPVVGDAMGRRAQERDAEILKNELACNIVRCSHYPQSPWFLDHCDRIGLLVLEELPGWQHIGDAAWKQAANDNLAAMIRRDRNRPSIVLWGVRVNESPDDHDFYALTNATARSLDPTRQTGGIRCMVDSELLEDVYTMNEFILGEELSPATPRPRTVTRDPREVTGLDQPVPYLITEFGGHMYPTKSTDGEERQIEHVLRHLDVINSAFGDPHIAGCIGWVFADHWATKDFGSGDRICHHGVLDMHRNPKFAGLAYASQTDPAKRIVMEPVTCWTRGDRAIGGSIPLVVLTNCDRIDLRYGDHFAAGVRPAYDRYPHLPRPPVIIDYSDFETGGLDVWGMPWADAELVGYLNGREVARRQLSSEPRLARLELLADHTRLNADGHDSTRVTARALDQAGNVLPYLQDVLKIQLDGPADIIGPAEIIFRRGHASFWIKTRHEPGPVQITAGSNRFSDTTCTVEVATS